MAKAITDYTLDGDGTLTTFVGKEVHNVMYNVDNLMEVQMHISEQNNELFNNHLKTSTKYKFNKTNYNILIAEFMGGVLSSVPNLINLPQTRGDANIHSVKGSEVLLNGTYSVHRLSELKYHLSWDWLMPVVVRLFDDEYNEFDGADDLNFRLNDALLEVNLDSLYSIVLEFINEYNKTK